jgi:UDP:flavonoid glycosyltransferase YjiC (YdhE family)
VPQETLLPHAAAVLGHGGFGTTMGALSAGVPQAIAPLFSFDQVVNGNHVAASGAGVTAEIGPGVVQRAAERIPLLLEIPTYAESASRVAAAMRDLPPPSEAVAVLADLAG